VVFVLTLALSTGALAVLHELVASPARPVELAVLIAAGIVATVTRYVGLRSWVFAEQPVSGSSQLRPSAIAGR
jgi:putative flippase GtrA